MESKLTTSWRKYLMFVSLSANILLLSILAFTEYKSHTFGYILERRGMYEIEEKKRVDYWAVRGWWNTINKMDLSCDAVFFGNSITHGSDFQQSFPSKSIVNLGYCGNNLVDMKYRVNQVIACHPKKIFIMAGTNDLCHVSVDTYKNRYIELLSIIQDSLPNAQIYIQSVLPTNHTMCNYASEKKVKEANKEIEMISKDFNATFIDLYNIYENGGQLPKESTKDGVHLKKGSYKLWAEKIREYVEK